MDIFYSFKKIQKFKKPTIIAIGNFDGLHLGHNELFKKVLERKAAIDGTSAIFTFDPHPAKFFAPHLKMPLITTAHQKINLFKNAGFDYVILQRFTKEFASMKPMEYIKKILVDSLQVSEVVVGYDWTFGFKRLGNVTTLKQTAPLHNIKTHIIPQVRNSSSIVSSTKIREEISKGDVSSARSLLGRNYKVAGMVIKGKGRGTKLGFATANILCSNDILPKNGIYACKAIINNKIFPGAVNIGFNPTFEINNKINFECHLIGFEEGLPLYGETIEIEFIKRLRDEVKFDSIQILIKQIEIDVQETIRLFNLT